MGGGDIRVIVPEKVYFGGDIVRGQVELTITTPTKNRGVRFYFAAKESTHWKAGKHSHSQVREFLTLRFDFAGTPRDQRKNATIDIMEPGKYQWPFTMRLPTQIPPSCKLVHGEIEYIITAYVDIPMGFDIKQSILIHVAGDLFNQLAYSLPTPPIHKTNEKEFLLVSGKLHMEVTIRKFHYVRGDIADLALDIKNDSDKLVEAVEVSLIDDVIYRAGSSTNWSYRATFNQVYKIQIPARSSKVCNVQCTIPLDETPTTSILASSTPRAPKLVKLSHVILVSLHCPWAINLRVEVPITVIQINPNAPMDSSPVLDHAEPVDCGTPMIPTSPSEKGEKETEGEEEEEMEKGGGEAQEDAETEGGEEKEQETDGEEETDRKREMLSDLDFVVL